MPQEDLAGVEGEGVSQKKVKAIEDGFAEMLGHRGRRMTAGKKELESSAVLVALFHKHNVKVYYYDDKPYTLATIEKIKLKPKDEEPED